MPLKIFMVACEASGDNHGAHLIREIRRLAPDAEFRGLGGPQMQAAGLDLLFDMTTISALGFGDVVRQYFKYRKIFYQAIDAIRAWKPDAAVVIDSPAFNLRLAKKISGQVPVLYYISPQIWAWGGRRIHVIRRHVSKMLSILPFETEIYEKAKVPCEFVGHPLLDQVETSAERAALRAKLGLKEGSTAVGLFPGSRAKEVQRIFPAMLATASILARKRPDVVFYLKEPPGIDAQAFESLLRQYPNLKTSRSNLSFHDLVHAMDFAMIASGTATLEAALLETPFFLLYKASPTTYFLGKRLIRVKYLGLVNLLAGRLVVPEFIQGDMHPETMAHEIEIFLQNPELCGKMRESFREVRALLGNSGASRRAAEAVVGFMDSRKNVRPQPSRA
ncbi:MAG TPA: lipid-A-disaccharide synthase [Verrucomicrobiae bacterium]|jgi:lipid-A-disaccharide synthase|nr:lipid-A-disaccharide synthase [Verrucomicrobiae bacterium]